MRGNELLNRAKFAEIAKVRLTFSRRGRSKRSSGKNGFLDERYAP